MPRQTYKQMVLSTINERILLMFQMYCILPSSRQNQREMLKKELNFLLRMYCGVSKLRYAADRSQRCRPANKFSIHLPDIANMVVIAPEPPLLPAVDDGAAPQPPWLNETEFLTMYRMTKQAFWSLVRLIENHWCFKNNGYGPLQQPVEHQVMVLLHYIGTAGSGASNQRSRQLFLIGYGTVLNYKQRVIQAIRDILRPYYYSWPEEDDRIKMSSKIQEEFLLPNCVGAIDGTTFPFVTKPQRFDASDFHGRKDGYTLTGLFCFDHRRRIRYYNTGVAGSAHDNRIFTQCDLYNQASSYFSHNEYVVGDSAFQEGPFCVPTYRNPTGGILTGSMESFNTVVGRFRVVSEHGFGHLKGRFRILSCLPIILTDNKESEKNVLGIVDTCVILHNFILTHNAKTNGADGPFFYTERKVGTIRDTIGPLAGNNEMNLPLPANAATNLRRERLRAYLSTEGLI